MKSLVHCGKCGDKDGEEDHDHADDEGDNETIAHCGKCGDKDGDDDHDHDDNDDDDDGETLV